MQSRQNQQKAELANIIRQYAAPTAGNDTWNLLNSFWGGAELDPVVVNEMLQNITDAMATDAENKVIQNTTVSLSVYRCAALDPYTEVEVSIPGVPFGK